MRRRVLLGMAARPPTAAALVTRLNGPLLETGSGAKNTCAMILAPTLPGFKPVLSVTNVPLEVKFSDEVNITDAGCSAAS